MSEPPKKKGRFNHNAGAHKRVDSGIFGLFFTCEGHEKQAITEAKNLIDQAVSDLNIVPDTQEIPSKNEEVQESKCESKDVQKDDVKKEDEEVDFADALKEACVEECDVKKSGKIWSRQKPTGVKNCLFLTTPQISNGKDIYKICDNIITKCQDSLNTRFLYRIEPVEITCDVAENVVDDHIKKLINEHFAEDIWAGYYPTYAVNFRARNNNKIKRDVTIQTIGQFMSDNFKNCRVHLNNPDLTIVINIVHKTAMLGIVQNYNKRRKLSLKPIAEVQEKSDDFEKIAV
uniref:THUMP domain-containing protein n=1 Tax=Rhabditophanes sp. KR3021 TaxID=114890 RepID=A0AC35TNL8_9BILA